MPYCLEMHVARSLSADLMNTDTSNLLVKIKGQKTHDINISDFKVSVMLSAINLHSQFH